MKGLLGKFRPSRKLLLIFGGITVLCGATGSAAVYIGRDALLGPSYAEVNGLSCTQLQSATIKRKDRLWIRQYVTTDATDGLTRVKTAMRVARAVAETEKEKPDLIQVVVLDKNGPKDRSDVRGHAIGADVIYVPNPAHLADATDIQSLTARYVDRPANASGEFYGERIEMSLDDANALMAKLTDKAPCESPVAAMPEGEGKKDGHGKDSAKDGGAHGKTDSHGKTEGHGEADAHGESKPDAAGGHGEAAPAEGASDAHGGEGPAPEKPGLIASLKGMIFGAGEKPAVDGHPSEDKNNAAHPAAAEADGHAAAAAAEGPAKPGDTAHAPKADNGDAPQQAAAPQPSAPVTPAPANSQAAADPQAITDLKPQPAESKSWLTSIKSMVSGGDSAKSEPPQTVADDAKPLVREPSSEPGGQPSVLPRGISLR